LLVTPPVRLGSSSSQLKRSLANVLSHEYMESLTDAVITAWYDSSGSEIGDECKQR
jgi:hypothetical protein